MILDICRRTISREITPAQPDMGTEPVVIHTVNGSNMDAVKEATDTRFVIHRERLKTMIEIVHATGARIRKGKRIGPVTAWSFM